MNTKTLDRSNRHQLPMARGRTIAGALLTALGITLAQTAFADRDSFPAWQQRQFAGQTAQREMTMTAPHTVLAGRDSSFQNWHHRQHVDQSRAQQADIATAHTSERTVNPGVSESGAR